ncbi:MAG TPA: hypothetical protein VHO70_13445 [Chitinispirillaceae bacterium]|nr:hypothetical protein [Chitinispirillaceae bacterium]
MNLFAQYPVSLEKKVNYKNWGAAWDTIFVLKNEIVTLAILPKIGGRIMQYDLKDHPSIYIEESAKNAVPADGNAFIGGYRAIPSPQSDFSWPAPPAIDCKPYTCKVLTTSEDSTVVYMESQVENSTDSKYTKHKGLQFKKVITLYKASTRAKVEVTMLNKGTSVLKHGIWDITQSDCSQNGTADTKNFWAYFKKNPSSTLGNGKGYVQYMNEGTDNSQWRPDAAPGGIFGVQYLKKTGKIGADCSAGWIAFIDQLDGYAYIKKFTYESGKEYPDSGSSVQVYTYNNRNTTEVEVHGPLVSLSPNDSTKMVENWFCARSIGPALDVNDAGIVTSRITAQQTADTLNIKGTYGLFYPGVVKATFVNKNNVEASTADTFTVTPFDSLAVSKKYKVPSGAVAIRLVAFNSNGNRIGVLDSASVPNPVDITNHKILNDITHLKNSRITLKSHSVRIAFNSPGKYVVNIFTTQGKLIERVKGIATASTILDIPLKCRNTGVLQIRGNGWVESSVICDLR